MARVKSKKHLILEQVKAEIFDLLKGLEKIEFCEAEIYIVDEVFFERILELEKQLKPHYLDTARGKVFTIFNFLSVLNYKKTAISYHFTTASKSKLVTDREKVLDRLDVEMYKSKNTILMKARDRIEELELDEALSKKEMEEAQLKIDDEEKEFKKIKANPDAYDIIISTFKERKTYPQLNYKYVQDGKQIKDNKHISIEKVNILIYDENYEADSYRSDMKVARFIKQGYRALGDVFVRLRK